MTQARSTLVSTSDIPYYHCVSRCVRRAFLCGYDTNSQTDYEHRRQWLEDKLFRTADTFSIKLCAYAVMSNHYHVVVHIHTNTTWSKREVLRRWHSLFNDTYLSQSFAAGEPLLPAQIEVLDQDIETWRERLCSLSWFMKVMNESIARRANLEDKCTGHFSATAPALLYLLHPCSRDYLELVDWTGRIVREDKRGQIDSSLPPILRRLSLDRGSWLILTTQFERQFGQWVGYEHIVRQIYTDRHYQRIPSTNNLL